MSARFVFGSSIAYLVVLAATSASNLVLVPLMTRYLTPADYGVMLLIANGCALINLLFGFSFAQAMPPLFASAPSDTVRRAVCTTISLTIVAVLAAAYLIVSLLVGQISAHFLHTSTYDDVIRLGALSSFLSGCAVCLVLVVRLSEQHKVYLFVQLPALVILVVVVASLLVYRSMGVESVYIAMICSGLFTVVSYAVVLRDRLSGRLDSRLLGNASQIGLQMLPWQLATVLTTNSAAFFLTKLGQVEDAGRFLVANNAAALLVAVSASFENVWYPFVLLRKDQPDLDRTQIRIFSLYSSALLIAASGLSLFAHELFVVLVGPAFREAYRFVPALCLCYCIFCFANAFAQGLQARQRTVHYSWIGIAVSAVFLALALILPPLFGVWGIIAAMGAGFVVMLLLLQLVSSRLMPVAYPWPRHGAMWLIAFVIVFSIYPLDISWAGVGGKIAALTCIVALPFMFGVVRGSDFGLAKQAFLSAIH